MDKIRDSNTLLERIRSLAYTPKAVPEGLATRLRNLQGSPADQLLDGAEILYAHYDELGDDGKLLVGQIYDHAVDQNWTGFNKGERGTGNRSEQIVGLVRRDLGERGGGVAAKSAEYPEPETNRRDGVDWRPKKEEAGAEPS